MTNATYKLTLGPLIDTIFVFKIGDQDVNIDDLEGTLNDVSISDAGINIKLELGGIQRQAWTLEVTVDDSDRALKTVPDKIEGEIGIGGGSWFDETCPLVER